MDIVPKSDRVLAGCFTMSADQPPKAVPKRTGPWMTNPRTLTGSMKMMTRYVLTSGVQVVRLVEPLECFAMMGWCGNTWSATAKEDWASDLARVVVESSPVAKGMHVGADMQAQLGCEPLSDMSGNAWTLWHIGPVWLALLATWGRYFLQREEL